ncbi:hypothetical protein SAMN06265350_10796 [Solitalea koreensis]|uniref:Uncharacterized protein n=1 Tax=Solitalea koreensis TaxID=543615 RepID=A0A521DL24_9SPHI|nr:hypothetical protein SAMN06265350_10796 [Solitalea koreensis]
MKFGVRVSDFNPVFKNSHKLTEYQSPMNIQLIPFGYPTKSELEMGLLDHDVRHPLPLNDLYRLVQIPEKT